MSKKNSYPRSGLRKLLLLGSLLLPIATGLIAAFGKYKDPWSGFEKPFGETFVLYAIPVLVAPGSF